MSRLRTNLITNRMANGAPTVSNGLVISGVTTTSDIKVGTGVTLNVYGGATFSGIVTASSFSGIDTDKISEGNTEVETIDTGSDGHIKFTTEGTEKLRITSDGNAEFFNGSNSSTIKLKRHASTASQQAHIGYFSSGLHIETREATYISLKTSTQERLRITSAGDLLIGNSNGGAEAINMVGGGGGILISRSASDSPSDGQTLGDIGLNSYSASQTCSSADVLIRGQADGAHSGTSAGSALLLFTKPASTGPGSAPTERLRITKDGHLKPGANATYDLGVSGAAWRNLYVNDAHFSNEGHSNSVDGTWGSWTLQEGENDIFMINNRTGKKFAITMKEVN